MSSRFVGLGLGVLAIGFSLGTFAMADKLKPQDVPAKIRDTAMKRLPGAKIDAAEKEVENGNTVYDLELTQNDRKFEMDIKEDGTLMEIEKEVKNPPAAVTKAVKDKYADAKIDIVMEVNAVKDGKETPQNYEVTLTIAGKQKEVVVALDGSSVKEEAAEAPEKK